jgi:hypothetical protein
MNLKSNKLDLFNSTDEYNLSAVMIQIITEICIFHIKFHTISEKVNSNIYYYLNSSELLYKKAVILK